MATNENLQDQFLNEVRKDRTLLTVFLMNGFQLKGVVTGFDSFAVMVVSEGRLQMIYKHAISTIIPLQPVKFTSQG